MLTEKKDTSFGIILIEDRTGLQYNRTRQSSFCSFTKISYSQEYRKSKTTLKVQKY